MNKNFWVLGRLMAKVIQLKILRLNSKRFKCGYSIQCFFYAEIFLHEEPSNGQKSVQKKWLTNFVSVQSHGILLLILFGFFSRFSLDFPDFFFLNFRSENAANANKIKKLRRQLVIQSFPINSKWKPINCVIFPLISHCMSSFSLIFALDVILEYPPITVFTQNLWCHRKLSMNKPKNLILEEEKNWLD